MRRKAPPPFQTFLRKAKDFETQENWDKIWAGCQAEPSEGLTTSRSAEEQSPEALAAEGWGLPRPTWDAPWKGPQGQGDAFLPFLLWLPCEPAFKTDPTASHGHIFWITIQLSVLFHPQIQFDTRVCKGSIYRFDLGLCQLATDSDARTIIIALADLLWQKGCIVSVGSAGCGSLSSHPY